MYTNFALTDRDVYTYNNLEKYTGHSMDKDRGESSVPLNLESLPFDGGTHRRDPSLS